MSERTIPQLTRIAVSDIDVLNPRDRNQRIFDTIIANIQELGLKRPITVTPRTTPDGALRYLLICGEGRLKALKQLGETSIPALVIEVDDENAYIMSLAENIARRHNTGLQSLAGIESLKQQGYSPAEIAKKTGLSESHVGAFLSLLASGEERLLDAVAKGRMSVNVAMNIARAGNDHSAIQHALQDAYESGALRATQLKEARKIIQYRELQGRSLAKPNARARNTGLNAQTLVRTYQKEVARQRQMVRKAEFAQQRLLFVIGALRQLFADEHFLTLLRAENLDTLPRYLSERVTHPGGMA